MEALRSFETSGNTDAITSLHISSVLTARQLFLISFPIINLLIILVFPFLFLSFFSTGSIVWRWSPCRRLLHKYVTSCSLVVRHLNSTQ